MSQAELTERELSDIKEHTLSHRMTVAVLRSPEAPSGLEPLFRSIAKSCGLSLERMLSSPNSDFGMAELYSKDKMLVLVYVGGQHTELVGVSETDEVFVKDLEESIVLANYVSSTVRDGL